MLACEPSKPQRQQETKMGKIEATVTSVKLIGAAAVLLSALGLAILPQATRAQAAERSGEQVVKGQCVKCHEKGVGGAPKVGDRNAWATRMKQGMDALVASAIRGHGGMPARGDKADLTDSEVRSAILYMFNPAGAASKPKSAAAAPAARDATHKLVQGTDIYLGVLPAEAMRSRHSGADGKMQQAIPSGKGYFHVSVVLRDADTKAEIKDAQVEARVANLVNGESKKLEAVTINDGRSYANYFRMAGKDPYTVTLTIRKPGAARAIEAKFDLKR
jgi:cytochrome c5